MLKPFLEHQCNKSIELLVTSLMRFIPEECEKYYEIILDFIAFCESPIEAIFFVSIVLHNLEIEDGFRIIAIPQHETNVNNYKADFLVQLFNKNNRNNYVEVLVECDGHNYHEITKSQVKKRNERDLALKKNGYDILHFSGSQIYNNPQECVKDVYEYLLIKYQKGE